MIQSSHPAVSDLTSLSVRTPETKKVISLAGNPNVGKSTVFNALTGLRQHTGNWPGKTVENARGTYKYKNEEYAIVDVPGAYSLLALSAEEEAARDFICFGGADVHVVVCDATCLERNLNLALQTLEISGRVIVAVNLMDEASRRGISVDTNALSKILGVPVIPMSARRGRGLKSLSETIRVYPEMPQTVYRVRYSETLENAVNLLEMHLGNLLNGILDERWTALRLLEDDGRLLSVIDSHLGFCLREHPDIKAPLADAKKLLYDAGYSPLSIRDEIVSAIYNDSEKICAHCVSRCENCYDLRQLRTDRLLTRRSTGLPVMLALLALVFFITIKGANVPSDILYAWLSKLGDVFSRGLIAIGAPTLLHDALIYGVWRVLSWVTSVMLPPMAIFFPLFTLLEDLGYLPRFAFNLDESFRRAGACGKQCLTMCMGFGCNAAGVSGCRIIDSPRERLIAIITNSFVPCNGRFPLLITLISVFFVTSGSGILGSIGAALMLTCFIILGVFMTLTASRILAKTFLKGVPSSMTLELPPFRPPQIGRVIIRSVLDRTLFVLGRAVSVAAPTGLFIWLLANIHVGSGTLLSACTDFLDPAGRLLGMDGVILTAFILALPANEIVLPIIIMTYSASGMLIGCDSLDALRQMLVSNGWTWLTALNVCLFSLMHWPCSTTLITVKKETGSFKWVLVSIAVPTVCGIIFCFVTSAAARLFGLI